LKLGVKPGGVLWLLRHEMRVTWRNWWGSTKARGWGRIILYVMIALGMLGGGFGLAALLGDFPPVITGPSLVIVSAIMALIGTFMLSQSLMLITDALYQRGDLDLLLASPLPAWRVLIVRMGAIALNVAALYLVFLFSVFIFLPFFGGWAWMGVAPAAFALALAMTGLGIVLARVLFRLIGPRRTRAAAQVLAALIGVSFFLFVQFNNFAQMDDRITLFEQIAVQLQSHDWPTQSIAFLPARAVFGSWIDLVIWCAAAAGFYAVMVWGFARRFVVNAATVSEAGGPRKIDTRTAPFKGGGVGAAMVRKEWRLLRRDPMMLSQVLLPLFYFAPLAFVLWRAIGDGEMSRGAIGGAGGAFVFVASILSSALIWLTVSAEDAPDLMAAAPVPRHEIERAKAFAACAPVLVLLLIPAALAASVALMAGVWLLIGGGAASISSALVGIWHQTPGSRKNFRRRAGTSLSATIGQTFLTFSWAAATGLSVAGWPLLGLLPAIIAVGVLLALHESRKEAG
jgi:ABC-2 type transport system permease protein